MFHSDQGVQYTAYVFRQHLRELKVKQSFSTPGNPYDNSVCESFFHTLKKEALYHHLYETSQELEEVLEEYIEFYNGYRPQESWTWKLRFSTKRSSFLLPRINEKFPFLKPELPGSKMGTFSVMRNAPWISYSPIAAHIIPGSQYFQGFRGICIPLLSHPVPWKPVAVGVSVGVNSKRRAMRWPILLA